MGKVGLLVSDNVVKSGTWLCGVMGTPASIISSTRPGLSREGLSGPAWGRVGPGARQLRARKRCASAFPLPLHKSGDDHPENQKAVPRSCHVCNTRRSPMGYRTALPASVRSALTRNCELRGRYRAGAVSWARPSRGDQPAHRCSPLDEASAYLCCSLRVRARTDPAGPSLAERSACRS